MAKRGKNKAKGKQPAKAAEADIQAKAAVVAAEPVIELAEAAGAEAEALPIADEASSLDAAAETAPTDTIDAVETIDPVSPPAPGKTARPSRKPKARARDQRPPFLVLADYEERSLAHVAGLPEQLDAPGLWRGVAYRIGSHRLASGFDEVVEILPLPALTTVPGAQPWMLGVANVRGTLLPVVDLKQFLEGERTVLHESQRVLVVRQPGGEVAVTIDELFGQRSFVDGQGIDTAQLSEGRYGHFIDRAYRMGEQDWGVFSLDRLARTPEFRQAAA